MGVFSKIWEFVLGQDRPDASSASLDTNKRKAHPPQSNAQSSSSRPFAAPRATARSHLQDEGLGGELPIGPSIIEAVQKGATGGVQGLDWYRRSLREDQDGDVAEAFLCESSRPTKVQAAKTSRSAAANSAQTPLLEVRRKRSKRLRHGKLVIEHGDVHLETETTV